jgi:LuxR family transcriptional regulator, maltose regulon positive regulatory protein
MTAIQPVERRGAPQWPVRAARDTVRRPRLVAPLAGGTCARVALLVAPAGYGKTVVLCEWAARDRRPFAWVTLDDRDNDPERLLARVVDAIAHVADPHDPDAEFVLVLDDVHVIKRAQAVEALHTIEPDLPPQAMLAVASRTEPPLPIARWRAQRELVELHAEQLAMRSDEAAALLRAEGQEVERDGLAKLLHQTEGWPAGLTLALLAGPRALTRFGGEDSTVADYLREEMLDSLAPRRREFLRRTAVLDVLTGPLCDAVLERSDSSRTLHELARANVLLVPLDRRGERFRYHHLLADTLLGELRRVEPGLEPELHRRASRWYRAADETDEALRHALAAGDVPGAARMLWRDAATELSHGRGAVLDRRLARFAGVQAAGGAPLALTEAARALVRGRGDLVEHWMVVAGAAEDRDPLVAAGIAALRGAVAHHGLAAARADALRAAELAPDVAPCRALSALVAGTADYLTGEEDAAVEALADGVRRAAVTAPGLHALCLTQLAVIALEGGDREQAAGLITRARAQIERFGLARDAVSALVFAASALVRAQRGRVDEARRDLREVTRLEAEPADFAPWFEAEVQLLAARAALRLCDVGDAEARARDAARALRLVPESPVLAAWHAELREAIRTFSGPDGSPPSLLTTAELRVLRHLPTHLSFREIAERTFVSANTVKTQANAVYRKLDVSSRSEAVARARELGLLDDAA